MVQSPANQEDMKLSDGNSFHTNNNNTFLCLCKTNG